MSQGLMATAKLTENHSRARQPRGLLRSSHHTMGTSSRAALDRTNQDMPTSMPAAAGAQYVSVRTRSASAATLNAVERASGSAHSESIKFAGNIMTPLVN